MRRFRGSAPERVIVKTYGRDSLLFWLNPVMAGILGAFGRRVGLRADADVLAQMERDALAMAERGYRVTEADEYALPVLGLPSLKARYYRVTYELAEPA